MPALLPILFFMSVATVIEKVLHVSTPDIIMQYGGKTVMEGSFIAFSSDDKGGLLCSCSSYRPSDCINGSWSYPDGTKIPAISDANQYFVYEGSFHSTDISLFHKGIPSQRGKFTCTWSGSTFHVYIVDLSNQTGPFPMTVYEGDDTEFLVSVDMAYNENTDGIDSQILYQWQKNGVNVKNTVNRDSKYHGAQSANLSIFNVQMSDEGSYRCVFLNVYVSDGPLVSKEVRFDVGKS